MSSIFGVLGDIHGDFAALTRILERHPEVPFWLCVGDIASAAGEYPDPGAPVYFIKGNNENFDAIAAGDLAPNLRFMSNGVAVRIAEIAAAGLGGTFAPTWYETPARDLPHPKKGSARATELADKRRHFVREEVVACKALRNVDVFLSHEAPSPFRPSPGGRGHDAGKAQINEVLAALQPRLHFFGHHHRFTEATREGVPSIGLDLISSSYVIVDHTTFQYRRLTL